MDAKADTAVSNNEHATGARSPTATSTHAFIPTNQAPLVLHTRSAEFDARVGNGPLACGAGAQNASLDPNAIPMEICHDVPANGAVQTGLVSLEANPSTCQRTDIYVKYQSLLQSQRNALSDGDSNQIGKNAAQQTLAEVQADLDDARTGSKALAVHVSKLSSENEALRSGNAVITQQLEEARWYAGEVQRLQYLKSSTEIDIGAIQMNQQTECNADALGALDSEVEQQRNEEISKLRKMVVQLQSQANEAAVWNQMARDELQERRREFSTIEAGLKSQLAGAIGELNSCKAALEETQKQYNVMQWVDSEYALAQCTNAWRHTEFDATEEVSICDYDAVIDEMEQRISRQVSVLQERLDLEIKNNLALSMQVAELSTLARRAHTHTQALQEKDSLIAELKSCVEQQQNELEQLTALLHAQASSSTTPNSPAASPIVRLKPRSAAAPASEPSPKGTSNPTFQPKEYTFIASGPTFVDEVLSPPRNATAPGERQSARIAIKKRAITSAVCDAYYSLRETPRKARKY